MGSAMFGSAVFQAAGFGSAASAINGWSNGGTAHWSNGIATTATTLTDPPPPPHQTTIKPAAATLSAARLTNYDVKKFAINDNNYLPYSDDLNAKYGDQANRVHADMATGTPTQLHLNGK